MRNVARRDGLGIVMLAAADAIGALPDYYFQAVGSAAGALGRPRGRAATDRRRPLRRPVPQLMLAQNAPVHAAVRRLERRRAGAARALVGRRPPQIAQIGARCSPTRRRPTRLPAACAKRSTEYNGTVFAIENSEMLDAMMLFAELEGIDIDPEAGVATAALMRAVADGRSARSPGAPQCDRRRPRGPRARDARGPSDARARSRRRGRGTGTTPCARCSFPRAVTEESPTGLGIGSHSPALAGAGASRSGHLLAPPSTAVRLRA